MTEAAVINKPGFWTWGRWPMHLDDLNTLGIDVSPLQSKPIAALLTEITNGTDTPPAAAQTSVSSPAAAQRWGDVIAAAKVTLGAQLGVRPANIEITIRA